MEHRIKNSVKTKTQKPKKQFCNCYLNWRKFLFPIVCKVNGNVCAFWYAIPLFDNIKLTWTTNPLYNGWLDRRMHGWNGWYCRVFYGFWLVNIRMKCLLRHLFCIFLLIFFYCCCCYILFNLILTVKSIFMERKKGIFVANVNVCMQVFKYPARSHTFYLFLLLLWL